jgi:hypothetical protein
MTAKLTNIVDGLALDIRIGTDGLPQGLANAQAVIAFYDRVFDALRRQMTDGGMPAAELEQVMRGLEPVRAPETVEGLALRDPTMFFLVCGGEFRLGEKREYEDRLPNPFGGDPFPSRAHFLLKEIRDEGREALVEWRQTLDPEKAREILLATFRAMAERMGKPRPAEKDVPAFSSVDEALFVMDVATGWPRSVAWERTTVSGPAKRVERTLFTRLPPESK